MKKLYTFLAFSFAFVFNSIAQCPTGQINVTVDVTTDDWGYECFWDITPTGNGCGNGALFTFGNTAEVNCTSGGSQVATSGGYGNNVTITEAIGCQTIGNCFDINYVDDYGDGGATFLVKYNGVSMHTFTATETTSTATYTFCVSEPPVYDAEISASGSKYLKLPLSQSLGFVSPATIKSAGTGTITGVKANVKVTNGSTVVHSVSSATQTLTTLSSGNFTVAPYTATSFGVHTVSYATQINEIDEVTTNDSTFFSVDITDTILAVDDGVSLGLIGLGSGELGYLGTMYEINHPTKASSVSLYLGNGTQVTGQSAVDSVFKVRIFNTNAMGVPTTVLATTSGIIENDLEKWYTVMFASPVTLPPGKYMVALEEQYYMQEIGLSEVFHPQTSLIYSQTLLPWSPVEDFGLPATFMIRLNLETSGLAVAELVDSKLTIFPNPTSNQLTISNTEAGAKLQVYNQVGQMVFSSETAAGNTTLNVQSLANGLYTIKTIANNKIGVAKFIKE